MQGSQPGNRLSSKLQHQYTASNGQQQTGTTPLGGHHHQASTQQNQQNPSASHGLAEETSATRPRPYSLVSEDANRIRHEKSQ